jgi:Arc/MetJ family transcription regulator
MSTLHVLGNLASLVPRDEHDAILSYIPEDLIRYPHCMTKRLIDVDDEKLAEVRALLGTATAKATVNGALDEVIALAKRRTALVEVSAVAGSDDLADEERRRAAWG